MVSFSHLPRTPKRSSFLPSQNRPSPGARSWRSWAPSTSRCAPATAPCSWWRSAWRGSETTKRRWHGRSWAPGSLRRVARCWSMAKAVEVGWKLGYLKFSEKPYILGNELEAIGMLRCFRDDEIKLFDGVSDLHGSWMRHAHCGICSGLSGEGW